MGGHSRSSSVSAGASGGCLSGSGRHSHFNAGSHPKTGQLIRITASLVSRFPSLVRLEDFRIPAIGEVPLHDETQGNTVMEQ